MTTSWSDFNDAPNQYPEFKDAAVPTDDIRHQLIGRLDQVLSYLLPAGRIKRGVYEIGDIQGNKGDSLKIELNSGKAGMWHDFANGAKAATSLIYGLLVTIWIANINSHRWSAQPVNGWDCLRLRRYLLIKPNLQNISPRMSLARTRPNGTIWTVMAS